MSVRSVAGRCDERAPSTHRRPASRARGPGSSETREPNERGRTVSCILAWPRTASCGSVRGSITLAPTCPSAPSVGPADADSERAQEDSTAALKGCCFCCAAREHALNFRGSGPLDHTANAISFSLYNKTNWELLVSTSSIEVQGRYLNMRPALHDCSLSGSLSPPSSSLARSPVF